MFCSSLACFTTFALYPLAVDLQVMLGGALVLGLKGVGAGFAQSDSGGGEIELGLLDDDGLEWPTRCTLGGGALGRRGGSGRSGTVHLFSTGGPAGGRLARGGSLICAG